MEPRHYSAHRHLEGGRDVPVRHILDVEEYDRLSGPSSSSPRARSRCDKLLPQRGLALRARRRRAGDWHRLRPGHHLPPPQQVQAEPPGDGDEPREDRPVRIEPLEVDEGPNEGVLREILGVGRPEQSPAEAMDGPVKAQHQRVEGRRIAATGATRKVKLCSPTVRIRARGRSMTGLYDRTLLAVSQESTSDARGLFLPAGGSRNAIVWP